MTAMQQVEARPHGIALAMQIGTAGVVSGLAAGAGMIFWMMIYTAFVDDGLLIPLKLIGATFYGQRALGPGWGAPFWGLVLHLAVSVAIALLFAAIVKPGTDPMALVSGAVVYGLLVWVVTTFLVVPVVDPVMKSELPPMATAWFGAHVVYGAILGITPQVKEQVARALREPRDQRA